MAQVWGVQYVHCVMHKCIMCDAQMHHGQIIKYVKINVILGNQREICKSGGEYVPEIEGNVLKQRK